MKVYSIIITFLFLVAMTSMLFPTILTKDRDWVLLGSFGYIYLRGDYTIDSVYNIDNSSYVRFSLSDQCRKVFLNDFNFHTVAETEEEIEGKIMVKNFSFKNSHQYLYLKNGEYGYKILDLSGDTLIEWTLYDE